MSLLWGRARPFSRGGVGRFDRGAYLDNIGLRIFTNNVVRVRRIDVARDLHSRHPLACDVVLVQHVHSPHA